jgi:hypothetical protein
MSRVQRVFLLAAPGVVLAGLGFTHPDKLNSTTADWWTNLHLILVPLFPLLGVALWVLVARARGWLAWAVRISAFGYIVFYGALDVLAGIATGTLVKKGTSPEAPEVDALFDIGNDLGFVGSRLFVVACVLCAYLMYTSRGRSTLPAGIILVLAAFVFRNSHIYWPYGVLSCLGLALGMGWLGAKSRLNLRDDLREDLPDRLAEDPAS